MRTRANLRPSRARRGFTLVEMLVALAVILVLAAITILVVPDVLNRSRAAEGADRLQGGLLIAKQRALRDQKPRGLRLLADSDGLVRRFEYVEVPEEYAPGGTLSLSGTGGFTLDRGAADIQGFVLEGDWIELADTGEMYRITVIAPGPTSTQFTVLPPATSAPSGDYRFIRQARPLLGEQPLELPRDVVIDLQPPDPVNPSVPAAPPGTPLTILFTPAGSAYVPGGAQAGRIIYWVRDTEAVGEPTLICVYARTGAIAAHPVDVTPNSSGTALDPYSFTRDGRSSGL